MWEWADWTALGRVADVASLVAAGASVIAVLKIGALKRRIVFNARMEPLVGEIRKTLEQLTDFADAYPERRIGIEAAIRQCLARLHRHEKQLPKDVVDLIRQLKALEKSLDAAHTDPDASGGLAPRQSIIEDMMIKLNVVAVLVDETRISRQIGGEDA